MSRKSHRFKMAFLHQKQQGRCWKCNRETMMAWWALKEGWVLSPCNFWLTKDGHIKYRVASIFGFGESAVLTCRSCAVSTIEQHNADRSKSRILSRYDRNREKRVNTGTTTGT